MYTIFANFMNAVKVSKALEASPLFNTDAAYGNSALKLLEMSAAELNVAAQDIEIKATAILACAAKSLDMDMDFIDNDINVHEFTNMAVELYSVLSELAEAHLGLEYEEGFVDDYFLRKFIIVRDLKQVVQNFADSYATLDILCPDDDQDEDELNFYEDAKLLIYMLEEELEILNEKEVA